MQKYVLLSLFIVALATSACGSSAELKTNRCDGASTAYRSGCEAYLYWASSKLSDCPNYSEAHYIRGVCFKENNELDLALASFLRAESTLHDELPGPWRSSMLDLCASVASTASQQTLLNDALGLLRTFPRSERSRRIESRTLSRLAHLTVADDAYRAKDLADKALQIDSLNNDAHTVLSAAFLKIAQESPDSDSVVALTTRGIRTLRTDHGEPSLRRTLYSVRGRAYWEKAKQFEKAGALEEAESFYFKTYSDFTAATAPPERLGEVKADLDHVRRDLGDRAQNEERYTDAYKWYVNSDFPTLHPSRFFDVAKMAANEWANQAVLDSSVAILKRARENCSQISCAIADILALEGRYRIDRAETNISALTADGGNSQALKRRITFDLQTADSLLSEEKDAHLNLVWGEFMAAQLNFEKAIDYTQLTTNDRDIRAKASFNLARYHSILGNVDVAIQQIVNFELNFPSDDEELQYTNADFIRWVQQDLARSNSKHSDFYQLRSHPEFNRWINHISRVNLNLARVSTKNNYVCDKWLQLGKGWRCDFLVQVKHNDSLLLEEEGQGNVNSSVLDGSVVFDYAPGDAVKIRVFDDDILGKNQEIGSIELTKQQLQVRSKAYTVSVPEGADADPKAAVKYTVARSNDATTRPLDMSPNYLELGRRLTDCVPKAVTTMIPNPIYAILAGIIVEQFNQPFTLEEALTLFTGPSIKGILQKSASRYNIDKILLGRVSGVINAATFTRCISGQSVRN